MNSRTLTVLTGTAATLALGEFGSAIIIWRENYPGSLPWAAVAFAVFFIAGAWLLRSGRVMAGTILAGVLCLFEVVSFSGWARHSVLDWAFQITFAAIALVGLIAAIAMLADRLRHRAAA
jgi:hypothetical protein